MRGEREKKRIQTRAEDAKQEQKKCIVRLLFGRVWDRVLDVCLYEQTVYKAALEPP